MIVEIQSKIMKIPSYLNPNLKNLQIPSKGPRRNLFMKKSEAKNLVGQSLQVRRTILLLFNSVGTSVAAGPPCGAAREVSSLRYCMPGEPPPPAWGG
jgi:hypothetical protein